MKICYLGTAAAEAIPALFCRCDLCNRARKLGGKDIRTRSQAVIDDKLLIDFPPDGFYHSISGKLDLPGIKNLIITHSHSDHCYLLDLMQHDEPFAHGLPEEPLHIFGNKKVQKIYYDARAEFAHIDTPDSTDFTYIEPFVPFKVDDYWITALKANHDKSEDCYIYIIEKDGSRLLYANDTGMFPEETWDYIKPYHFDVVSMDCTMVNIRDGKNHMGLEDDFEMRKHLINMYCADETTKFVITHFSHNGGLLHSEIEKRVADFGIQVAYDGMEIVF